jgi:2-keto-3-deoxy-6-phosphogluconate aldolase
MVTIYMRNTNASARVITIQASTTTSGYANVNLSPATPGAASVVSVSLAATSGTAVVKLFNANGSICGALT